jgi:hypothetical protein
MKKYITNLYGHKTSSTAMQAQNLVTTIAKQEGYSEIKIGPYFIKNETENDRLKIIEGILSGVSYDSMVVVQMPTWYGIAFDELLLQSIRTRVEKLIIFVHDFVPLMFLNNAYLFDRYLSAYNLSDLIILPSQKMEEVLVMHGLISPVVYQGIWDFLDQDYPLEKPEYKKVIKFSGNMDRFPFVKKWNKTIPLEVFSEGSLPQTSSAILKGWLKSGELLKALNEGGFGLVWSDNIENQNEKEYSEMNASFKFSTYLAAGLPIIVNEGLAKENFVREYQLGCVVSNLDQAVEYVQNISIDEYDTLVENVKQVGLLIKDGFFTRKLLSQIQETLFLEKKEKRSDNL